MATTTPTPTPTPLHTAHLLLLLLLLFLPPSSALNVLFVLPCFGGHFSAMSNLIEPVNRNHNVTVLSPAMCPEKVHFIQNLPKLNFVQRNVVPNRFDFSSTFHYIRTVASIMLDANQKVFKLVDDYLTENSNGFDVLIADCMMEGAGIAAESHDLPLILQAPGEPAACSPDYQEVLKEPLIETLALKIIVGSYMMWRDHFRNTLGLPRFLDAWNFGLYDYYCRFPLVFQSAPILYPKPDPTIPHIYLGALRNLTVLPKLNSELVNWVNSDKRQIVYLSLGSHGILEYDQIKSFLFEASGNQKYKFIWAVGHGIYETVSEHGMDTETEDVLMGYYLPQFAILQQVQVVAFVSHAGLLSTLDAIKTETPLICVPQFADQFYNCDKAVQLGIAIQMDTFHFHTILAALSTLAHKRHNFAHNMVVVKNAISKEESEGKLSNFIKQVANVRHTSRIEYFEFSLNSPKSIYAYLLLCMALQTIFTVVVLYICKILIHAHLRWKAKKKKT